MCTLSLENIKAKSVHSQFSEVSSTVAQNWHGVVFVAYEACWGRPKPMPPSSLGSRWRTVGTE